LARFWTNELQRPIVVVTNQSGIGRGYFDENAYAALMQWMCDRFEAEGTAITRTYHCPYHPLAANLARGDGVSWQKRRLAKQPPRVCGTSASGADVPSEAENRDRLQP
jgi:hypothetical protein